MTSSSEHPVATPEIELLAPAGNWACAKSAVENGADAIYFGLDAGFNARARADNFHLSDLPELMDMLHGRQVRGYVTLNTLVFTDELEQLEENVRHLAAAGVDAVLVQDLGVAKLVREICPTLQLHASTQMTLTNAVAVEMASQLGISRAVLARELSIREIKQISQNTKLPLEAFVHGALCVAYSGQCLTSESLGGRSANRGQCAQACRMPYEIYRDGEHVELGDQKYLLSPQDLAAHDYIDQMIDAGVCSLKIEGRLKTPEYVANVCQHYRLAIDEALAGRHRRLTEEQRRELELSFSRGFSPGWLEGCDHKRLVPGLSSSKRGVLLGEVERMTDHALFVRTTAPLAPGDGIVISGDRFADEEIGGRVYELLRDGQRVDQTQDGLVEVRLQHGLLAGRDVPEGTTVFKTDDPKLTKRLQKSFTSSKPIRRLPIEVSVAVSVGEPLRVSVSVTGCQPITLDCDHVPEVARKHAMTSETLTEQFSRLGGTRYELSDLTAEIAGEPMVPLSVLGALRKQMVRRLDEMLASTAKPCSPPGVTARILTDVATHHDAPADSAAEPTMRVLCRSLKQIEQSLACGIKQVIADLHDIRQHRDAVRLAREAGAKVELATLRIHKPGEDGLFKAMHRHEADGWLVRSLSAMQYCIDHQISMACDFSLNVTNPLTAARLMDWGASRITASYDLNRDQLLELVAATPADWMEVVVHQHMPMFHMEHCVFCSVLSPGKNKSDCGRPCDRHDVKLTDRVGAAHVLHADIGCRNTLYNGTAQSGAEAVRPLLAMGIRNFRVELLRDSDQETTERLIGLYRDLLHGKIDGADVWRQLKADNRIGVTRGTLEQPRNPLAIL
ncbi:MAG: DUF3656 domain-containing protein [Aureliella sp.]